MKSIFYALIFLTIFSSSLKSQTPDNSFNGDGKTLLPAYSEFEESVSSFLQPDGKIILGGYDYDETFYYPSISVWRVLPNGSVDSNFGNAGHVRISGSPFGGSEYGGYIALQPDNKIIGAGTDFDRDGLRKGHIVLFRLKANGTYDSTFGTNGKAYANVGGFTNIVESMLLKPDGKIVVGGRLYQNNNDKIAQPVQFLPNGKLDSSFGVNGVAANYFAYQQEALAISLSSDNKIIAAFKFAENNTYTTCLVKYNNDGTVDKSFGNNGLTLNRRSVADYTTKIALSVQPGGKILEYTSVSPNYSPSGLNALYSYNNDGSPDQSFGIAGHIDVPASSLSSIDVTTDNQNRILVNTPFFGILRYLSNGKTDSSFGINGKVSIDYTDSITGSYARSEQVLVQPDSKIIGVGYLDSEDGLQEFMLARFKNVDALKASTTQIANAGKMLFIYPNPVQNNLSIKGFDAAKNYSLTITDRNGNIKAVQQVSNSSVVKWNIQNLKPDTYFVTAISGETKIGLQFIKQ